MVKEQIIAVLKEALGELGIGGVEPLIEHPKDEAHGDYTTNIALVAFEKRKEERAKWKSPLELAQATAKPFTLSPKPFLDRVEVAPPGFINFWLSREYLVEELQAIEKSKERFGKSKLLSGKKIMVEFTDPNPFKEFHVGHLYSNAVGEAICRLLESQGAKVARANYQGDVGLHVAKAVWGLGRKMEDGKWKMEDLEKLSLNERVKFLGEAYAFGARAFEEDQKAKNKIEELNKRIYKKDPDIMPLYEKGRAWSLEYFESIYARLGTKFDYYYFESKAGNVGEILVREYLKKGVFVESDGAVIFPGERYGLHNRVFINSLGLPTYEAKELGLAPTKYNDFPYDQSIIVTGSEINAYFKVLLEALKRVRPDLGEKTKHLSHGMVRLPTGKMSSRTGEILSGEWLLDEAKGRIEKRFPEMDEQTSEKVSVGAVKYALLKSGIGRDIAFDIEESISFEGNSGPYLQYTFARTQSVLAKLKTQNSKLKSTTQKLKLPDELHPEEVAVLRALYRFPEIVEEAAAQFFPNTLCSFLFSLAQKYNLFYQKHQILNSRKEGFRLALTAAVGQVLNHGLHLLGIEAPERM